MHYSFPSLASMPPLMKEAIIKEVAESKERFTSIRTDFCKFHCCPPLLGEEDCSARLFPLTSFSCVSVVKPSSSLSLLFILLEYLVLNSKAKLLFEQTTHIQTFPSGCELNPCPTCSLPLQPQLPLPVISPWRI